MDDEFFASVLKKWAYSSQEVVDLKRYLGRVERERNEYKRELADLKARECKNSIDEFAPLKAHDIDVLDLDEVGNQLEKARLEYQRRLRELNDTRNREEVLRHEVEELRQGRTQMQAQLQASRAQCAGISSELSNLRIEKDAMATKIFDLTLRVQQAEKVAAAPEQNTPRVGIMNNQQVAKLQEQMTSLETQLQEIQSLAQTLEVENATLREELIATRGSLQRTKEANKGLRMTINQLSRIARNVAGAPELALTMIQNSNKRPVQIIPPTQPQEASKPETDKKELQRDDADFSLNDVTMVAEPSSPLASMSPRRLEALVSLPVIIPDTDINDEDNKFTRGLISAAIRRNVQPLIVRATSSRTDLAKGRNTEEYLCPRLDHNPWCPSTPGQHGYMFVSFGKEKNTYTTAQLRNLFVGLPKDHSKEERHFRYLGVYRVSRVDPLDADEWRSLRPEVKQNYLHATKKNNLGKSRTKEEIADAYNSGEASVPCIKLQCVDFDEELYAGLVAFRARQNAAQNGRAAKRSCDEDDEIDARLQRNKRRASRPAH